MSARNIIDRLYPLNGGLAVAPDRSVYTPGKWNGEQITFSCNCYLMHHGSGWTLWDTGISDSVAEAPPIDRISTNLNRFLAFSAWGASRTPGLDAV